MNDTVQLKKRTLILLLIIPLAVAVLAVAALFFTKCASASANQTGNYSNEMKMEYRTDLQDHGANIDERRGDHEDSPYYYHVDFYNAESTDTLSILPHFQTIQQTSWWSCGVSSVEMVLNYYGMRGNHNEETLANLRRDHSEIHMGSCLDQMIDMFDGVGGFDLETTYDYMEDTEQIDLALIRSYIQNGIPVIVGWCDWAGHWQVIIGYDTMGTEYEDDDVIIVADPFDTTDHNQDGYGVYGADRFIYNFTFFDFFGDENHVADKCFIAATPKK